MLFLATGMLYFLMYEWSHLVYHTLWDRFELVRSFGSYHATHHNPKKQRTGYNVTVPIWDWILGTYR